MNYTFETITWGLIGLDNVVHLYREVTTLLNVMEFALIGDNDAIHLANDYIAEYIEVNDFDWSRRTMRQQIIAYRADILAQKRELIQANSTLMRQAMANNPFRQ